MPLRLIVLACSKSSLFLFKIVTFIEASCLPKDGPDSRDLRSYIMEWVYAFLKTVNRLDSFGLVLSKFWTKKEALVAPLSRICLQIDLGPTEPLRAFTLFFFRNFKAKFGPRLGLEPFFAYFFARFNAEAINPFFNSFKGGLYSS